MALSTGQKVAIGCGVAAVGAALVVVAGIVGVGFWAKGKLEKSGVNIRQVGEQTQRTEQLLAKANRNGFTSPADGSLAEDRLVKFLAVRRQVFSVYERHKGPIEAMEGRKDRPDLSAIGQAVTAIGEVRLAYAQGLADQGMSEAEYRHLKSAVYRTLSPAGAQGEAGKLDAPPGNAALLRKYEPEIRRYQMAGLEHVGL